MMRLLSYNIHKGIGGRDRRYRLDRIIDVIAEQKPDIICLQEVQQHSPGSDFHDQPRMIAEIFEFVGHHYQMNVSRGAGGYGNQVLSRWPFREHHRISLKRNWRKSRGAQLVVIETPTGLLHLVNWHLGLSERERQWQADRLLKHRLFSDSGHLPTLIVGDTNDWRNSLAKSVLCVHEFRQATAPPSRFRSFPAFGALVSLDKAFYRGGLTVERVHIVHGRMARSASDHLPLIIDFGLTESCINVTQ